MTTSTESRRADEAAEPYAALAEQLVARVRTDQPRDVHRRLYDEMHTVAVLKGRPGDMPTVIDWMALAVVLAAAVPTGVEWSELTGWRREQ